jgi:hypothetical protein
MTREKLLLLNAFRWLKAHAIEWGLLGAIYSFTLAILVQTFVETLLRQETSLASVWLGSSSLLLVPLLLERLPTGNFGLPRPSRMPDVLLAHPLASLYLAHELRRLPTWITLFLTVALGGAVSKPFLWIPISLLPMLRALYSWGAWRRLAAQRFGKEAGKSLIEALFLSQTIQGGIAWLALGASTGRADFDWLAAGAAQLGAIATGCSASLEGDSGRPWLVQTFVLAAGIVGGAFAWYNPWLALIPLWFFFRMRESVRDRVASVEPLDEDAVLS